MKTKKQILKEIERIEKTAAIYADYYTQEPNMCLYPKGMEDVGRIKALNWILGINKYQFPWEKDWYKRKHEH